MIKVNIHNLMDVAGLPYYGSVTGEMTLEGFTACQRCGALIDQTKVMRVNKGTSPQAISLFMAFAKHEHDHQLNFCLNCYAVLDNSLQISVRVDHKIW